LTWYVTATSDSGAVTVKLDVLVAVPAGVVTEIGPLAAPGGTVAVIDESDATVNADAAVPLNATAVAPVKPWPASDTFVPGGPLRGSKAEIAGAVGPGEPAALNAAMLFGVPPGLPRPVTPS
jgi:hypothetical protein